MIQVQFETNAADFKAFQQFAVAAAKASAPSFAGYIVPKRAFESPAQLGEFLAFARTHAGGSRRQIPTGAGTS